jgi:hypothetical protein
VLTCVSGSARIALGSDDGIVAEVSVGDVTIIPAGVGHKRLSSSADFLMAGGYPPGQSGNIVRPEIWTAQKSRPRSRRRAAEDRPDHRASGRDRRDMAACQLPWKLSRLKRCDHCVIPSTSHSTAAAIIARGSRRGVASSRDRES